MLIQDILTVGGKVNKFNITRIAKYVTKIPGTTCTGWAAYKDKDGYPNIQLPSIRTRRVLRILWKELYGEIPEGMVVRHTCNNPSCLNPQHLVIGTKSENAIDAVYAGTLPRMYITPYQAKLIKGLLKAKNPKVTVSYWAKVVAGVFKVSQDLVRAIARGKSWSHIQ